MADTIDLVSDDATGGSEPSISADGRYVVYQGQTSHTVYVEDRSGPTTTITALPDGSSPSGTPTTTNGYSYGDGAYLHSGTFDGSISADGSRIIFLSPIGGTQSTTYEAFATDSAGGAITLVSDASGGASNSASDGSVNFPPVISGDGGTVAFVAAATNLAPVNLQGTLPNQYQIYAKQLGTSGALDAGDEILVSSDSSGHAGTSASTHPELSADGSLAVFQSFAANFAPPGSNVLEGVYRKDLHTGTLTLVSQAGFSAENPSISGDGSTIAFDASGSPDGTHFEQGIFVEHDGVTTLVSTSIDGTPGNGYSIDPKLSADGRYVSFYSTATNLGPPGDISVPQLFVKDLMTGEVTQAFTKVGSETYSITTPTGGVFT